MAETTGSSILPHGDSHGLHSAGRSEEFPDSILSSVEAKVAAEDGVSLTGCSAGRATKFGLSSRELNVDLSII